MNRLTPITVARRVGNHTFIFRVGIGCGTDFYHQLEHLVCSQEDHTLDFTWDDANHLIENAQRKMDARRELI